MVSYWVGEGQRALGRVDERVAARPQLRGRGRPGRARVGRRGRSRRRRSLRSPRGSSTATGDLGAIYAGFSEAARRSTSRSSCGPPSHTPASPASASPRARSLASALSAPNLDALTGCLSYGGVSDAFGSRSSARDATGTGSAVASSTSTASSGSTTSTGHLHGNEVLSAVGLGRFARRRAAMTSSAASAATSSSSSCPRPPAAPPAPIATRLRGSILDAIAEATRVPVGVSIGIAEWDGEATATELFESPTRRCGRPRAPAAAGSSARGRSSAATGWSS